MKMTRRETWSPFRDLGRLREEIDRLFGSPYEGSEFVTGWGPALDFFEDKDRFTVKCELPGVRKEDIDISVEGNTLSISGERKHENEQQTGQTYRSERYFGRFQRNVTLPQAVDANNVSAQYKDGVLTVSLPKTEESRRKQIQIQGEAQ